MSVRPVGSLPASVYWRRRLLVLVPLLFLIGLTVYVAWSPGGDGGASAPVASTSSIARSTPAGSTPSPTGTPAASGSASPTPSATSAPAPAACVPTSLQLAATTSAPGYAVGSEPQLSLQVTNTGLTPCNADLADAQVELTVFNGDARVWGSHDCKVEPGTAVSTLAPNQPVKLSITWTGLSSEPGCTQPRVRVLAGTYTLHASLAGTEGATAQFALS